jgi:glucose/arabinose dehydrogenase
MRTSSSSGNEGASEPAVECARLLAGFDARIRDVRLGPDGLVYVSTDSGK